MNILYLAPRNDIYTRELTDKVAKVHQVSIFDINELVIYDLATENETKIEMWRWLEKFQGIRIFRSLLHTFFAYAYFIKNNFRYDIIHILYFKYEYVLLSLIIKKISERIVITVYGDDYFLSKVKWMQTYLYNAADSITFNNPSYLDSFKQYYKISNSKLKLVFFGFDICDSVKNLQENKNNLTTIRAKYSVPKESLVVVVGTNGEPSQNHWAIIERLEKTKPDGLYFIIPLTYSSDKEYLSELITKIKALGNSNFRIVSNYLSLEEISELRAITDIQIQFQTSDSLSGAMVQTLFGGALVLVPKWLKYPLLDSLGIYYQFVQDHDELIHFLSTIKRDWVAIKSHLSSNRDKVRKIAIWNDVLPGWLGLYN